MLATSALIAFVATAAPERAKAFYRDVLGLRLRSDEEYALVFDANGRMLRVAKVEALTPLDRTVVGWQVEDIESVARQLGERGVQFERYGWMDQDDLGIWTTQDGARVAWFRDPEGNVLSLTQFSV
ncbi:MAG: VOC family protein [Chloroflexi bacterium]|nr:MAG: VOC family protein [Chloroflexota bacterium]